MASLMPSAALKSYCLISTLTRPGPRSAYAAMCGACVTELGFPVAVHVLRALGVVGIYASTSIENSQTLSALQCNFCAAQIPPVRCLTSSEFSR